MSELAGLIVRAIWTNCPRFTSSVVVGEVGVGVDPVVLVHKLCVASGCGPSLALVCLDGITPLGIGGYREGWTATLLCWCSSVPLFLLFVVPGGPDWALDTCSGVARGANPRFAPCTSYAGQGSAAFASCPVVLLMCFWSASKDFVKPAKDPIGMSWLELHFLPNRHLS